MSKRAKDVAERDLSDLKVDADDLKDTVGLLAHGVVGAADTAKDWAEPRIAELIAWLRPRAEKAWRDSVKAAAPHVEKFAADAAPHVDAAHETLTDGISVAHDKVLDELLPRLVAIVNEAAKKHGEVDVVVDVAKKGHGRKNKGREVVEFVNEVADEKKSHHHGRKLLAAGAAGVAVAGYTFWKRAQPQNDPWAEPWDQDKGKDYSGTVKDAKYRVEEVAEKAGEATGTAYAKGRELAEDVSERTADLREDIAEKAGELKDDLVDRTADLREHAAELGKEGLTKARDGVTTAAHAVEHKAEELWANRKHDDAEAPADDDVVVVTEETVLPVAETVVVEETAE